MRIEAYRCQNVAPRLRPLPSHLPLPTLRHRPLNLPLPTPLPIPQQLLPRLQHHPAPSRRPPIHHDDHLRVRLPHRPHELLAALARAEVAEREGREGEGALLVRLCRSELELGHGGAGGGEGDLVRSSEEAERLGRAERDVGRGAPRQRAQHRARQLDHAPTRVQPYILPLHLPLPFPAFDHRPPHTLHRPCPARHATPKVDHALRRPAVQQCEAVAGHVEGVEGGAVVVGHEAGQKGEGGGVVVGLGEGGAVAVRGGGREDRGGSAEVGVELERGQAERGAVVAFCRAKSGVSAYLLHPACPPSWHPQGRRRIPAATHARSPCPPPPEARAAAAHPRSAPRRAEPPQNERRAPAACRGRCRGWRRRGCRARGGRAAGRGRTSF